MRAALLASSAGFVLGACSGVAIYGFLLRPDLSLVALLIPGVALGAATAIIGFGVVFLFVRWRLARARQPMGPLWGACLGLLVLALVTLVHAAVSPGASGWMASFAVQFLIALALLGWLAALLGALLGSRINRLRVQSGT